jgi:hypothetical protein
MTCGTVHGGNGDFLRALSLGVQAWTRASGRCPTEGRSVGSDIRLAQRDHLRLRDARGRSCPGDPVEAARGCESAVSRSSPVAPGGASSRTAPTLARPMTPRRAIWPTLIVSRRRNERVSANWTASAARSARSWRPTVCGLRRRWPKFACERPASTHFVGGGGRRPGAGPRGSPRYWSKRSP